MGRDAEFQRRMVLWQQLTQHDLADLEPSLLRTLRVYGGVIRPH